MVSAGTNKLRLHLLFFSANLKYGPKNGLSGTKQSAESAYSQENRFLSFLEVDYNVLFLSLSTQDKHPNFSDHTLECVSKWQKTMHPLGREKYGWTKLNETGI